MKKYHLLLVCVAASLLVAHRAIALDCSNAITTVDMIECADKDYSAADKSLNHAYSALKKTLDATGNELLLNAQRAWLKFRDASCDLDADQARGGTMAPLLRIGCLTAMTKERTKALTELIESFKP